MWCVLNHGISIHAPRTGSDDFVQKLLRILGIISIHAPRTGSDNGEFKPRCGIIVISIHAPRTGSDSCEAYFFAPHVNFNPRSPHGERRRIFAVFLHMILFQSTLPARGATTTSRRSATSTRFQSTLPARGATRIQLAISIHAPARGASCYAQVSVISIHAPRTGSDCAK